MNRVCRQPAIDNRAAFDARAAAGTFLKIDAARPFLYGYRKISRGSFNRLNFGIGDNFDVQMLADLDQFRRNDSHGAVVRGKGFVNLSHLAPDRRALFNQVDIIA